jgi:hypothetical protein
MGIDEIVPPAFVRSPYDAVAWQHKWTNNPRSEVTISVAQVVFWLYDMAFDYLHVSVPTGENLDPLTSTIEDEAGSTGRPGRRHHEAKRTGSCCGTSL